MLIFISIICTNELDFLKNIWKKNLMVKMNVQIERGDAKKAAL